MKRRMLSMLTCLALFLTLLPASAWAADITLDIKDGTIVKKMHLELPERITNIIRCKNPRCITSVERGLDQVFKLTDRENRVYRCIYCESKKSEY